MKWGKTSFAKLRDIQIGTNYILGNNNIISLNQQTTLFYSNQVTYHSSWFTIGNLSTILLYITLIYSNQ
ncbi:hypothetical protein L1887_24877 [Cichorium endivia]|nr:hypothetical protein L1887_24877 [Cichorium endivia]